MSARKKGGDLPWNPKHSSIVFPKTRQKIPFFSIPYAAHADHLRAIRFTVEDLDTGGDMARECRRERHGDRAAGSRCQAGAAIVALRVIVRGQARVFGNHRGATGRIGGQGDWAETQCGRAIIGHGDRLRTEGSNILRRKGQARRRERNLCSNSGQAHNVRTGPIAVDYRDGAIAGAGGGWRKGDSDLAVGVGSHGGAAGVGLGVVAGDGDAGDRERTSGIVGQSDRHLTGRLALQNRAEIQSGAAEGDVGADASEFDSLRAAGVAVCHRQGPRPETSRGRCEGYGHGASGILERRLAAGLSGRKIARDCH